MKRIIKSKYFGKIKDIECKDYLTLIINDWEVQNLKDYFRSEEINQYDGFFVDLENGDYDELYGYFGSIPNNNKALYQIDIYYK